MRVPATTATGPVADLTQDQIDAEFSHIIRTNFSGQVSGEARQIGHSWTPENPMGMANPRDTLGLPKADSGQLLTRARVLDMDCVTICDALPIPEDGVAGGGPEWLFPDPATQLEVHWTIPLVPPW